MPRAAATSVLKDLSTVQEQLAAQATKQENTSTKGPFRRDRAHFARQLLVSAASAVACTISMPVNAYGGLQNYQLTPEEVALLPEYCRHTQAIVERHGSFASQREWVERVGPSFMHMHHYCIALVAYLRSFRQRNTINDRNGYLGFAWFNYDYVIRNAEPTFVLLPEVYFRRGQVAFRQGRLDEARRDLEEAVRGDPRHFRAVNELSQVLLARGDRASARSVLEAGLSQVPDSRLLQSALQELTKSNPR